MTDKAVITARQGKMGKVHVLRPRQGELKPVLMVLASRGTDCLILCLRCLERFTSLSRFKRIYVLASEVNEESRAVLHKFQFKNPNAITYCLSAQEGQPQLGQVQTEILAENRDEVIIKLDENVFVTPGWLDILSETYQVHKHRLDIPLCAPLMPVTPHGRLCLMRFLKASYPSERLMYWGQPVEENWIYHRWIWEKIVHESLAENYLNQILAPYVYLNNVSHGLVMFDSRLTQRLLSRTLHLKRAAREPGLGLGEIMRQAKAKACVAAKLLVHHYGFGECEEYLREHVPLELVWNYLDGLSRQRYPLSGLSGRHSESQGSAWRLSS